MVDAVSQGAGKCGFEAENEITNESPAMNSIIKMIVTKPKWGPLCVIDFIVFILLLLNGLSNLLRLNFVPQYLDDIRQTGYISILQGRQNHFSNQLRFRISG